MKPHYLPTAAVAVQSRFALAETAKAFAHNSKREQKNGAALFAYRRNPIEPHLEATAIGWDYSPFAVPDAWEFSPIEHVLFQLRAMNVNGDTHELCVTATYPPSLEECLTLIQLKVGMLEFSIDNRNPRYDTGYWGDTLKTLEMYQLRRNTSKIFYHFAYTNDSEMKGV